MRELESAGRGGFGGGLEPVRGRKSARAHGGGGGGEGVAAPAMGRACGASWYGQVRAGLRGPRKGPLPPAAKRASAFLVCVLALLIGCQRSADATTQAATAPAARGNPANDLGSTPTTQPGWTKRHHAKIRMGVRVDLVAYVTDDAAAEAAFVAAFQRVTQLDEVMSDYILKSELNRLCAQPPGTPVQVSEDLFAVLAAAQEVSRRSGGAFDVTVGPVVRLWREARKSGRMPPEADLRRAMQAVGWQKLKLDPAARTVTLTVPGMKLDLGGIGKGFAGDEALKVLKRHGITRALFEAGGDIVVGDPPPGEQGWPITVWHRGEPESAKRELRLANCAIASSGDTEQFVVIDGKRYSHVVDPRTGLGVTQRLANTLIAPTGTLADAWSKVGCIIGPEEFEAMIREAPGMKAYVRRVPGE